MTSKYMSLYHQLRKSILNGSYFPGQKLPSSRTLAENLGVSRNTILEAFAHLEAEGYIESRQGSGIFVKDIPEPYFANLNTHKRTTKHSEKIVPQPHSLMPFRPGEPDLTLFPFHLFSRLSSQMYREHEWEHFKYENTLGYLPLREAIASYLTLKRQVNCKASQVMIVNGSQEAIFISTQLLIHKTTHVILEDPMYTPARDLFEQKKATIQFIPVDQEGMQVDLIEPHKKAVIYLTPSHQFPLGSTLSIQRRLKLLDLARKHDMLILEDDYDSDFRYNGEPLASLQGLALSNQVIYIGTLSKIIFPAIRLGFCVLPEYLVDPFLKTRKLINRQPSILNQVLMAKFFQKGYFYQHLKNMHRVYKSRREYLSSRLQKDFSHVLDVQKSSDSGLHIIAMFKKQIEKNSVRSKAEEKKLSLAFLSDYYEFQQKSDGLVLGFSSYDNRAIDMGLNKLNEVLGDD